jgi:hypothetical protein
MSLLSVFRPYVVSDIFHGTLFEYYDPMITHIWHGGAIWLDRSNVGVQMPLPSRGWLLLGCSGNAWLSRLDNTMLRTVSIIIPVVFDS